MTEPSKNWEPLPPHDDDAEMSVLGSILMDPEAGVLANGRMRAEDFYHPKNRDVYHAMTRCWEDGKPVDIVILTEELEREGASDRVGGMGYLATLFNTVPTSIHIEHYMEIVERTAAQRRIIRAGAQIAGIGYELPGTLEEGLAAATAELVSVMEGRRGEGHLQHILPIVEQYLESVNVGGALDSEPHDVQRFKTGYIDLDHLLGGLQRSDLVVLGARPSIGKTALALNIAWNLTAHGNVTTAVFSVEMSRWQVAQRILALVSRIDSTRLREGRVNETELGYLAHAVEELSYAPLYIDDTPGISLGALKARTRELHAEHPVGCVIVDYMQLLVGNPRQNRVDQVSEISRELKQLARETNACVMALSQLSRSVESRSPHIPMLADLRESGAIEQDADVVLLMYKEDVYDRDSERKGIVDLFVAKHRNGPTGVISLLFREATMQFLTLGRDPELEHAMEAGLAWQG